MLTASEWIVRNTNANRNSTMSTGLSVKRSLTIVPIVLCLDFCTQSLSVKKSLTIVLYSLRYSQLFQLFSASTSVKKSLTIVLYSLR